MAAGALSRRPFPPVARRVTSGRFPRPRSRGAKQPAGVLAPLPKGRWLKVGLMGGSFNPAHAGHLAVSREALRRLGLDQVWWLVSPANPLKDPRTLAPIARRLAHARRLVGRDRRIRVFDIEGPLGLRYTADTVELLVRRGGGTRFVWLMGADNLVDFTRWRRFADIARTLPLAILDRPHYSTSGLNAKFAARFRHGRLKTGALKALATAPTPAWAFLVIPLHAESATAIRRRCGGCWWAGALMS